MTMLITKFHRLIESKLLWGFFLLVVIFSFVIWGTQMPSQEEMDAERSIASLHGKPVPPEEFRFARFNSYLGLVMQVGRPIPFNAELDKELEPIAWRRLVSLQKARDLALVASDSEVVAGLEQQPIFATDGRFDRNRYRSFVQNYLPSSLQVGLNMQQFEDHIREQITLSKLQNMVRETVLVPPYELKRRYHIFNDAYSVEYAVVRREDVAADVSVDEAQARALFDENPARFELPPKVSVRYVAFPVEKYVDSSALTEQEIEYYYEQNADQFSVTLTNTPPAPAEGAAEDVAAQTPEIVTTNRPLAEVRDEIVDILEKQHARYKAAAEAASMVDRLTPDRDGKAAAFADVAKEFNLEIQETEPFSATDELEAFGDASEEFVANAFLLSPDPEESFSNPVETDERVYVMSLKEQFPARVPTFDEVRSDALLAARQEAISEAVEKKAKELATLAEGSGDSPFSAAAEKLGLTVSSLSAFTASTGLVGNAYAEPIVEAVSTLSPGETSGPLPARNEWIVVHLLKVEPAGESGFAAYERQVRERFGQQIAALQFVDWQEQLLREAGFERREVPEEEPQTDEAEGP